MARFSILIQGYGRRLGNNEIVNCSCVLIEDSGILTIVDPGMNRLELLLALKKSRTRLTDVDFVVLTHTHPDHALLASLFPEATVVDAWSFYKAGTIVPHSSAIPGTSIKLVKTPGHSGSHISVLFTDELLGRVCVSGDVFWWWDSERQNIDEKHLTAKKDPFAEDVPSLAKSRKLLLRKSDWIIPGHGKMFEVSRQKTRVKARNKV